MNKHIHGFTDFGFNARTARESIGTDHDVHGRPTFLFDVCVDNHLVTYLNRCHKLKTLNRHSYGSATRSSFGYCACGKVHLPKQPSSKDVSIWIGVAGHCG
jgi:hypothetical protein